MTTELTKERALLALPHLVRAAKRRETITYKDLAAQLGCHYRPLSYPLCYIRDEICLARGLPMLTAIVVSQVSERPSDGWLPEGTDDLSAQENVARFQAECKRVFAYKEWDKLLDELGLAQPVS
jgi:hypothetical protein